MRIYHQDLSLGFRVLVDASPNLQYLPLKTDQDPREWEFRL